MIEAATGMKRVEMKKNSASRTLTTGRMLSAYAAGTASTSTRSVDPTLALSELIRYGIMSRPKTTWNWSSVRSGAKVGGMVAAWLSGLNAVNTIHATGKKKAST